MTSKMRNLAWALLLGCFGGLAPAAAQPSLTATASGTTLRLAWPVSTNFDSQVETSGGLVNWQRVWPPHAAPLVNGWHTNAFSRPNQFQFFRVRYGFLTNSPVPTAPGVYSLSFVSGRLARTYRLNIPTNCNRLISAPLAFFLHGHGQTAASFAAQHPDLAQLANAAGMILVFPQSSSNERGTGWVNYDSPDVNDVQFLLDLLEHLAGTLNLDRQRVYAAGFSNGGQMVHFLGARTTNTFAAYAAVGASIGGSQGGTNIVFLPPPAEPMSILIVNATNDCQRPFWGGPNAEGSFQPAALAAADHWTSNNLCLAPPVVTRETNVFNSSFRPNYADDCPNVDSPPNTPWTNHVTRGSRWRRSARAD
ncbi:MAG: hypothetical protein KJ070_23530 [Verrucomicrobia bacterium]|nr:hypothetical protein [Verrucomicrobiota bacterium]